MNRCDGKGGRAGGWADGGQDKMISSPGASRADDDMMMDRKEAGSSSRTKQTRDTCSDATSPAPIKYPARSSSLLSLGRIFTS